MSTESYAIATSQTLIDALWEDDILPQLAEYIRIPAKSPHFDPDWQTHGHIEAAIALAMAWCQRQPVNGMQVEVVRLPGRTPVLLVEVMGAAPGNVLLYGHLDKQPEMSGWDVDKDPWRPVRSDDRLYGRGGADDGYAIFAALGAIQSLQAQAQAHPRCVVLIETCEESGSYDLPAYMQALAERIGEPDLVIALDSGCGTYDRLWLTTSLRGLAAGDLSVEILSAGVHSGDAGGIVPSSFRIARLLLERLETAVDGAIKPAALHAPIPPERRQQAQAAAQVLGETAYARFPWMEGAHPARRDVAELILDRTWRPALEVIGADGLPNLIQAGNVLRPRTVLRLSLRLPPTLEAQAALTVLQETLERDPPHQARVRFSGAQASSGWHAPALAPWLESAVIRASEQAFGAPVAYMGEGGTIPFMAMLGAQFPGAQFLIVGVLGPQANAHGPNEFLHIPTAKRLTGCVAAVIAACGQRER